jgi:hypothetical protein
VPRLAPDASSEMAILRRVVDPETPFQSADAARARLGLRLEWKALFRANFATYSSDTRERALGDN